VGPGRVNDGVTSGHPAAVLVEVLYLRVDRAGEPGLAYRTVRHPLDGGTTPDELAGQAGPSGAGSVVHSTSWRHEVGVGVVLTYAALPDPDPSVPAETLVAPTVVCSEDATRPQPHGLHGHHVAAHAVRHLAELAERDPTVAVAAREREHHELWRQVRRVAGSTPTLSFREAHAPPLGRDRRNAGHGAATQLT